MERKRKGLFKHRLAQMREISRKERMEEEANKQIEQTGKETEEEGRRDKEGSDRVWRAQT